MGLDLDSPYFGIKDRLKETKEPSKETNEMLINQLLSLSNQDWFELRDDFTREELLGIIVKLLGVIRDLKEVPHKE
jgi:hypothetical protein